MPEYVVSFRRSADKELQKLDVTTQRRVLRAVEPLAKNPRPDGCRKLQGSDDAYRIRVGDYRVIYEIHDFVLTVLVVEDGHRKDIYR